MTDLKPVCGNGVDNLLVIFSGGASSGKAIHERYENVKLALTDNQEASAIAYWKGEGIRTLVNDFNKFYEEANQPDKKNMETRWHFDKRSIRKVAGYMGYRRQSDPNFRVDSVVASGYKVTKVWLNRFLNSMLNMHPGNLAVRDENGRRVLTGDKAVEKAARLGFKETRSTVHIMNEWPDQGPVLVYSRPKPFIGLTDEIISNEKALEKFCRDHQEEQKTECDIPAFLYAIDLLMAYKVETDGEIVYIDGKSYPNGVEVGEI